MSLIDYFNRRNNHDHYSSCNKRTFRQRGLANDQSFSLYEEFLGCQDVKNLICMTDF